MGVVNSSGAFANPQKVCGRVIRLVGTRIDACEGTFKIKHQCLVAHVQVGGGQRVKVHPAGFHKFEGTAYFTRSFFIAGMRRVFGKPTVPLVYGTQIGKTALRESPHQVQGCRGGVVPAQHPLGVVSARLCGELMTVNGFSTERRQGNTVTGFHIRGAGFRELPGNAAHLNHRHRGPVGQHRCHLKDGTNTA